MEMVGARWQIPGIKLTATPVTDTKILYLRESETLVTSLPEEGNETERFGSVENIFASVFGRYVNR